MATILFVWELGGGLGHLMRIAPLAQALAERGHRVFIAARDLWNIKSVMSDLDVQLLPAPFRGHIPAAEFPAPRTFAHILLNLGFADNHGIAALAGAWRNLFDFTKPDVIIFEHSPTALLASRSFRSRRMVIGTGFTIPPNTSPWRELRTWSTPDAGAAASDEKRLLMSINRQLESWQQPPLARACELYENVDETVLATFPELDHYRERGDANYWGPMNGMRSGGKTPLWPDGPGKKVFAYLKPFPALPALLRTLQQSRLPSLILMDGIDRSVREQHASATMRFELERLDIAKASANCDLAITNATFGTTSAIIMAGKPLLMVPIALEQLVLACRVRELGVGLYASPQDARMIEQRFQAILSAYDTFAQASSRIGASWSHLNPADQQTRLVSRIEEISEKHSSLDRG